MQPHLRARRQFLQSTWSERGIGQGDIRDPHDSILAAARYLVRRGGPADERSFRVAYNWEIYYLSSIGDLWLPVAYRQSAEEARGGLLISRGRSGRRCSRGARTRAVDTTGSPIRATAATLNQLL